MFKAQLSPYLYEIGVCIENIKVAYYIILNILLNKFSSKINQFQSRIYLVGHSENCEMGNRQRHQNYELYFLFFSVC